MVEILELGTFLTCIFSASEIPIENKIHTTLELLFREHCHSESLFKFYVISLYIISN